MRLRILTRASDLARLQGALVRDRVLQEWPEAVIDLRARDASGDQDRDTPLWRLGDKGAFTSDLSDALAVGEADIVVHSWKDLPIEPRHDTVVAATLPRADARDVLLVRSAAVRRRAPWLKVLSSSPRRAILLGRALPSLLPWALETVECVTVRGNVPTRVARLMEGHADALVVAKAALDRLLHPDSPFADVRVRIRAALDDCRWLVLPVREHPPAAAQGALALEIAADNRALAEVLQRITDRRTWRAVTRERDILQLHGGGCHQALGASVVPLPCGDVTSVRGRTTAGDALEEWTLAPVSAPLPPATLAQIWPRPDERAGALRRERAVVQPVDDAGYYVTRAEALPRNWVIGDDRVVWVAGPSTWAKLVARGIWVHGSSEGLGHFDGRAVDGLTGRAMPWHRLTHSAAGVPDALATYDVMHTVPAFEGRSHFFWGSASEFRTAIAADPSIRDRWHGCGPGHTYDVVERLAGGGRVRAFLNYDAWLAEITA